MDNLHLIIQIVAHVLSYMNSCVNPILYAFLSENFRKAFRKVILCRSSDQMGGFGAERTGVAASAYMRERGQSDVIEAREMLTLATRPNNKTIDAECVVVETMATTPLNNMSPVSNPRITNGNV